MEIAVTILIAVIVISTVFLLGELADMKSELKKLNSILGQKLGGEK